MFVFFLEIPSYIFHYLTLKRLLNIKKSCFAHLVLLFISALMVCMIIFIGDLDNLPPTFFLYIAGIQYACTDSRAKKFTLALMLSSTVFAWNAFLDNTLKLYTDFKMMISMRLLFAVLLYLLVRFYGPEKKTELGNPLWRLMSFLTLAPSGIVFSIVLIPDQEVLAPLWLTCLYTALLFLSLFSFIGLLRAINVLSRQQKLEQQSLYAEMNRQYYESMKRQHFEIRRLKHDLSNHLHTILLLPDAEKEDYITHLLESPGMTRRMDYCGDQTINAVLSVKEQLMQEQNISLRLKLDIPKELPFAGADICVLFANALDNAIESCLSFPENERFIEMTARHQKGMLALSVKNPASVTLEAGNPLPSTTKPDAKNHGYGLRSMEEIVDHYQGSLEISSADNVFELFLYLPEQGRTVPDGHKTPRFL